MLIEENFIFLSIPRCASRAFEVSCINSGIEIRYLNNRQIRKNGYTNNIPNTHSHQSNSDLRARFLSDDYEMISIYREPIERLISAWKYVLGSFMLVDNDVYMRLSEMNNKEFITSFNKSIKSVSEIDYEDNKYRSFYRFFGEIIKGVNLDDEKFTNPKKIFQYVMQPVSVWTENDVKIRMFDIKHLGALEDYVKEKTGKDFKMERLNDTKGIITNLVNDDTLREFYFEKFEKKQKQIKSII